jgi:succinate dehydrogenase / fumarate reductase iron-sulfur subunit
VSIIDFEIRRFNRETDTKHQWKRYQVNTHAGMTVLEGLHQIQEQQDATLSWRYSCRMGICGSCAMIINGSPGLACNTQIRDVNASTVRLQSLFNFPVVKDLVPDLTAMFEKHSGLNTYLVRHDTLETEALKSELAQSPEELMQYLQFSHCTKCGACMAACPTVAIDRDFLGPMPLTAAHRYNVDSRDDGFEERKSKIGALHGAFNCHYAAECSSVCPKGVDPARAIQLMKRDLILDLLRLRRKRAAASLAPSPSAAKPRENIPHTPEFTVKS